MTELRTRATLPTLFSIIIVDLIGFGVLMPVLPYYADRFGANGLVLGGLLLRRLFRRALGRDEEPAGLG